MTITNMYVDRFGTVVRACQFDGSYESVKQVSDFVSEDIMSKMDFIYTENCIKLVNDEDKHYRLYVGDYVVQLLNLDNSRRIVSCDKQLFESTYTLLMPCEE